MLPTDGVAIDFWEPRSGIALALAKLCPYFSKVMVTQAVTLVVPMGLADRRATFWKNILDAAVATINFQGKDTVAELLPVFEGLLVPTHDHSNQDIVRQSVAILLSGFARHLAKEDSKVRARKRFNALATLEEVQSRMKQGSGVLLGAMVMTAGVTALHMIGSVIRNPDIQPIGPMLPEALQDPGKRTAPCLQTLLGTKFN